jgi:hypothetical protein
MRKSRLLVSGMAALGLLTVVVDSAGQAADRKNGVPLPTNGDRTLLAWQADVAWRDPSMDNDVQLYFISNSGGVSSQDMAARLAAIAPAAGPKLSIPSKPCWP